MRGIVAAGALALAWAAPGHAAPVLPQWLMVGTSPGGYSVEIKADVTTIETGPPIQVLEPRR